MPLARPGLPPELHVSELIRSRPIGLLGQPLGTRLTVEGEWADVILSNPLRITAVDGHDLQPAMTLDVSDLDLKRGVRYRLEGYETGAWVGPPDWLSPEAQASFQYRASFVVAKVIEQASVQARSKTSTWQASPALSPAGR